MISNEHDSALRRLEAGLEEQDRSIGRYDAAVGTLTEADAYTRMCDADERVSARQAWLHWVDDEGYRGLNAGPFSLRSESSEHARTTTPA